MKTEKELEVEFDKLFADLKKSRSIIKQLYVKNILESRKSDFFNFEYALYDIKYCNKMVHVIENELLPKLVIGNKSEVVKNRFSGNKCLLNPIQVAIYDFIIGTQLQIDKGVLPLGRDIIEKFDFARKYFSLNWHSEYMTLLD